MLRGVSTDSWKGSMRNKNSAIGSNGLRTRMQASRMACHAIDRFLAPSRQLMKRHVEEFGLDASKVEHLTTVSTSPDWQGALGPMARPLSLDTLGAITPRKASMT